MTTDRRRRSRRRIGSSTPPSPPARRPRPRGKRGEILALTQRWPAVWLDRLNGQLLDPKSDLDWIERLIRDQLAGMVLEAQTWGTWTHPSVLETLDGAKRSLKRLIFHYRAEKCEDADRIIDVALDGIGWLEKLPQLDPAPLVRLRRCPGPDCPRRWHWDTTDRGNKRFCSDACRLLSHETGPPSHRVTDTELGFHGDTPAVGDDPGIRIG
jgi:hypothetical protein